MLKLVVIPLVIMSIVGIFSMLGLNDDRALNPNFGDTLNIYPYNDPHYKPEFGDNNLSRAYTDLTGHIVMFGNFTPYDDDGDLEELYEVHELGADTIVRYRWDNGTGVKFMCQQTDAYTSFGEATNQTYGFKVDNWGYIGLLAVVGGMIGIAGITVLSSGIKSISIVGLVVIGFFGVLWWIITGAASDLLFGLPLGVGWIFYLFMTLSYVIGCVSMIVTSGGGAE